MDGTDMAPPPVAEAKHPRVMAVGRWLKHDFAEWVVGSWALIIGWFIFLTIFFNFLEMDGYFSRGLGEGSGVNPDLFQHIGWMFRLFAAVFLTLATKFSTKGMGGQAWKMKLIGAFCTVIVIAPATGFGLKALHGKYANASSIEAVADKVSQSNADQIATLESQKQSILDTLKVQTEPLNSEIASLDKDGKRNEELANKQKDRRDELQDAAQVKIDAIDAEIMRLTTAAGEHQAQSTKEIATAEPWPPLFVGLAQLFTMSEKPGDGAIFLCGVLFLICWVLLGDAICIFLPPALYALHLKDAQNRKVRLDPNVFADLQAQADELARRKANLADGAERAGKTKNRKKNRDQSLRMIEDQRAEAVKREEVAPPPEPEAPTDEEAQAEETETPAEEPAEETVNDNADSDASEPGAEESDDDGRRSAA